MNREEFLTSLEGLNVWKRGGERAPHKPLLLLLALGRLSQNENRLVRHEEVETRLRRLLESFGPPRKVTHPEFPFWHVQTDGLWEIPERENLPKKKGGSSAPAATPRSLEVRGGLPTSLDQLLRREPELVETARPRMHHGPSTSKEVNSPIRSATRSARESDELCESFLQWTITDQNVIGHEVRLDSPPQFVLRKALDILENVVQVFLGILLR